MARNSMRRWVEKAFRRGDIYLNALEMLVYVELHLLLYWCVYPFSSRYARKISKRVLNDSFREEIREAIARFDELSDNDGFYRRIN